MTVRPQISVAMATFNGAMYLPEQLASLSAQTVLPLELVVTDDGSSDRTKEIVESFAARAPFPVHWYSNGSRLGYKANFMRAVSLCIGDLVAFCDQDDVWYPNKLEVAAAVFSDPRVMLFYHEARVVRDGAVVSELMRSLSSVAPLIPVLAGAPWQYPFGFTQVFRATLRNYDALWYRSSCFTSLPDKAPHDQWYPFLAGVFGFIAFHAVPLADYRQHENNTYGIRVTKKTYLDRLMFPLENRTLVYKRLAKAAASRSELLIQGKELAASQQEIQHLVVGADAWQRLGDAYVSRDLVYEGTLRQRLQAWLSLIRQQAYGVKGFWSFGRKALLKDLVMGVLLAPLIVRYGRAGTGAGPCTAGDGAAIALAHIRLQKQDRTAVTPTPSILPHETTAQ